MQFDWKDRYTVGDDAADLQHQEWFRLARIFLSSEEQSVHASGAAFFQFTQRHFMREETAMRDLQYPFTATHVEEHASLVSTLTKVLEVGRHALTVEELHDFVDYCLVKHIKTCDAPWALYSRRNGVSSDS